MFCLLSVHSLEDRPVLVLLLDEHLVVLEDDGDSEQNAGTGANGAHEVGDNGEGANAHTSEGGGGGDVAVEHGDDGLVTEALDDHVLVLELLGHVLGGGAGHLDPGLGEERAGAKDEHEVDDGVHGVVHDLAEGFGWGHVVREASNGARHAVGVHLLPAAEELHEGVGVVTLVQELGEEVQVGHEGGLEDDRDVGGVEELDGVGALLATVLVVLDGNVHTEA